MKRGLLIGGFALVGVAIGLFVSLVIVNRTRAGSETVCAVIWAEHIATLPAVVLACVCWLIRDRNEHRKLEWVLLGLSMVMAWLMYGTDVGSTRHVRGREFGRLMDPFCQIDAALEHFAQRHNDMYPQRSVYELVDEGLISREGLESFRIIESASSAPTTRPSGKQLLFFCPGQRRTFGADPHILYAATATDPQGRLYMQTKTTDFMWRHMSLQLDLPSDLPKASTSALSTGEAKPPASQVDQNEMAHHPREQESSSRNP